MQALYGARFHPFSTDIPIEKCYISKELDSFVYRVQEISTMGGYALLTGASGSGKSTALRITANRLEKNMKLTPAIIHRPQSGIRDFYRELGDVFGLDLKTSNRFGTFKSMRDSWLRMIKATCLRPVLIIDEAQYVRDEVLSELRLLSSAELDSQCLASVILSGDERLLGKLQNPELVPLDSRIRERFVIHQYSQDELEKMLVHVLEQAGCLQMMTAGIRALLGEHSLGNPRTMMNRAEKLLSSALKEELSVIDEKLYHRLFSVESNIKKGGR
jgi:type II secretory pathway predicted ATPase ExeA